MCHSLEHCARRRLRSCASCTRCISASLHVKGGARPLRHLFTLDGVVRDAKMKGHIAATGLAVWHGLKALMLYRFCFMGLFLVFLFFCVSGLPFYAVENKLFGLFIDFLEYGCPYKYRLVIKFATKQNVGWDGAYGQSGWRRVGVG